MKWWLKEKDQSIKQNFKPQKLQMQSDCSKGPCTYDLCKIFGFIDPPPFSAISCIFLSKLYYCICFWVLPSPSLCRHRMYMPPNTFSLLPCGTAVRKLQLGNKKPSHPKAKTNQVINFSTIVYLKLLTCQIPSTFQLSVPEPIFVYTDLPAYSDTLGTSERCNCKQVSL